MSFLKGKMVSDLARRCCSGEEQLLACRKIARGHTAKLLLDKIMANALMETILNLQGVMPQVMVPRMVPSLPISVQYLSGTGTEIYCPKNLAAF